MILNGRSLADYFKNIKFLLLAASIFLSNCSQNNAEILRAAGYEADGLGFLEAVKSGDKKAVDLFLAIPELLDYTDKIGASAAMYAAELQDSEITKKLIDRGLNFQIFDNSKRSPLHYAVKKGSLKNATLLLKNGADPTLQDNYGRDALNVFLTFSDEENPELFSMLTSRKFNVEQRDADRKTALIIAAEKGFGNHMKRLIELKASPLAKDYRGKTALDYAYESFKRGAMDKQDLEIIEKYTNEIKENL